MRARLMFESRVSQILALTALTLQPAMCAPQGRTVNAAEDPEKVIRSLRQVAVDLNNTIKRYQTDLDREIALHDRGYRKKGGRRVPGADADVIASLPSWVVQEALRKSFAARMVSARRPGYAPAPLADSDRIQILIGEARSRTTMANEVMRRLLVVSAGDLNTRSEAEQKVRRDQLLKARAGAYEAAKKALLALPIAVSEADSPEQQRDAAWELMVGNLPARQNDSGKGNVTAQDSAVLPLHFEQGKKTTLIDEHSYRLAITDSGVEDPQGRHLFYQEEWVRRAGIVLLLRWAISVNTRTGQHTLLRRYESREFRGDLDGLYQSRKSEYLSSVSLQQTAAPPSMHELTSATEQVGRSREELHAVLMDLTRQIRMDVARNDVLLAGQNKPSLDDDLPDGLRAYLFLIRSRLAGTPAIQKAENQIRLAMEQSARNVSTLEVQVALFNGNALGQEGPSDDTRALLEALNRSDTEIDATRTLQQQGRAALTPDVSVPEVQLPALMRDVIVRIRRIPGSSGSVGTVRSREEVWQVESLIRGARQVKRTIVLIDTELNTGNQIPAAREAKYYRIGADEALEQIYDENAAQP